MIFGIWPGVVAADLVRLQPLDCPPEDTARTLAALRQLQGGEELNVPAPLDGGLDFFPDVFRPLPLAGLPDAVTFLLQRFRTVTAAAGIPAATPVHVTETGWPTGEQRPESTQAQVLAAVTEAVTASGAGVAAYEWFGLRDGLSTGDWTARFGVLRDDYAPKPAFTVIQQLIARHAAGTGQR